MEVLPITGESSVVGQFDRAKAAKEFQESKAGVKGLVDAGVTKIPRMFIHPAENLQNTSSPNINTAGGADQPIQIPIIDLQGLENNDHRVQIVDKIRKACETWGFFQLVNHGIPISLMDGVLESQEKFHEQCTETKMELYSRVPMQRARFYSNGSANGVQAANWRDSLACSFPDDTLEPEALPLVCRKEIGEYMKHMIKLRNKISELVSEALGLSSDYLSHIECMKSQTLVCNYYPVCPEPHLTLGLSKHQDPDFLTILLQDNVGGLQVLHQNHWVDVPPTQGALVANIGDFMQLISNDKFKSVEHRVLATSTSVPRKSAACFFYPNSRNASKPYGPIKELLSDTNQPIYREILIPEYHSHFQSKGLDGTSALSRYKF